MFCKYVNLVTFSLRHESLVNKVKMLLLYPVTLKQLNNGYKEVSVAPVTGLCNLESVFIYLKLKHAHTHTPSQRKGKTKLKRQFLITAIVHHVGAICSCTGPVRTFHSWIHEKVWVSMKDSWCLSCLQWRDFSERKQLILTWGSLQRLLKALAVLGRISCAAVMCHFHSEPFSRWVWASLWQCWYRSVHGPAANLHCGAAPVQLGDNAEAVTRVTGSVLRWSAASQPPVLTSGGTRALAGLGVCASQGLSFKDNPRALGTRVSSGGQHRTAELWRWRAQDLCSAVSC